MILFFIGAAFLAPFLYASSYSKSQTLQSYEMSCLEKKRNEEQLHKRLFQVCTKFPEFVSRSACEMPILIYRDSILKACSFTKNDLVFVRRRFKA